MELRAVERRAPTRGIRGSRDNVQREFGTPVGSLLQQPPHRLDRVRAGGVWDPRRCSTTYPGTPRPRRAVVHRLVLRQRSPPSLRMGERVPIRELSLGYRLPVHLPAIYGVRRGSPRPPRAGRRARTSEPRRLDARPAPASILDPSVPSKPYHNRGVPAFGDVGLALKRPFLNRLVLCEPRDRPKLSGHAAPLLVRPRELAGH